MHKFNRMIFFLLPFLCLAGAVFGLYVLINKTNSKLSSYNVSIGGKTFTVELADTILTRTRGLSGRENLPDDSGMLFTFPSSTRNGFWMKDMKFAIDIVWIGKSSPSHVLPGKTWEGKVIGVTENIMPEPGKRLWSLKIYYPPEDIDMALEVNAGAVKKYGLKIGDSVSVQK